MMHTARTFSLFVIVSTMATLLCFGSALAQDCAQVPGDVDCDGSVTSADVLCVLQKSLGQPSCLDDGTRPTVDLTGSWQGIWVGGGMGGELTANFSQGESTLTGEVLVTNSTCTTRESIAGTISGNTILFGTSSSSQHQSTFDGTIDQYGNTIRGNFVVTAGPCSSSAGIWSLVRN
jgi:hypothetical protein